MPINSFENYPMTWKPKLEKTNQPLYLSLVNQLEKDIADGVLLPGTKLPPQRELADFLDINVSTISRAFKVCEKNGLLSGTVGSGTFVSYDVNTNIFMTPDHSSHLVEMGSMMPEMEAISKNEITVLLQKMMTEPDFENLFQYGSLEGRKWQREAAVKLIEKSGYKTTADLLLPASGGQNAIAAILAGLFQPGDRIGTDPLTYPGIKSVAKMLGIQLVPINHDNNEISEDGLLHACKNENIKGIYIIPNYQNPTTHIMSEDCRKMIARIAKEKKLIVIEDGINSLFMEKPFPAVASYAPEQTIYIVSLSKTVAPALRLAYIAIPKNYMNDLKTALYNINISQSVFLMELSSRMIASKNVDKLVNERRKRIRKRNQLVNKYLAGYQVMGDDEVIFRWLLLPEGMDGEQFEAMAFEKGVKVYAAERFTVGKIKPIDAVRLAVAAPRSLEELEQGLKILKELLKENWI
ncbi:PLP-dependent aminotransferase family protein [Clostridium beijerinckii]|uniref:aminotransferase-like domain-containing protein n=1 Tax=Clostridium beijerinckii TaxID=1520 RepID=UPI00047ECF97|nr:PLP-dependent aminotransferase family protein [Clostridium beijerinckii]